MRKAFYARQGEVFLRFTSAELRDKWVAKDPTNRVPTRTDDIPMRRAMQRVGAIWMSTNHPQVHQLRLAE